MSLSLQCIESPDPSQWSSHERVVDALSKIPSPPHAAWLEREQQLPSPTNTPFAQTLIEVLALLLKAQRSSNEVIRPPRL